MAIHKLQVFLASRFDEFQELRAALKRRIDGLKKPAVETIDLNDNAADSRPPLSRCYEAVDGAELFVLLVKDKYGGIPPNQTKSYTHLEYRRALSAGSNKTILPFLIGDSHHPNFEARHYSDNRLGEWISEVRKKHTPKYLDGSLGEDQMASDIFDEVLARLVEVFLDVDEGEIEDAGDETPKFSEDSPIKLEQLALSPRMSLDMARSDQPLKILAANHAKEALTALNLHLPQVAIHHLRKAVELVPLDIVIGYWLARLLVATGRRRQCLEARRIVLLCSRVAAGEDNEGDHKLEMMACRVLAARASERLGELELARQYATEAHDDMPYHWMAKFEYGRQLALASEKNAALDVAGQAFWLRPDLIRQIQRDAAYRALGKDFEQFRAILGQNVMQETERISRLESSARSLSEQLDSSNAGGIGGPIEALHRDPRAIIKFIHVGRFSLKSTLLLLQQSATQLITDSLAFEFDGTKGLTTAIKESLHEDINTVERELDTRKNQRRQAQERAKQLDESLDSITKVSIAVGVLLLGMDITALFTGYLGIFLILTAAIFLGAWAVWQKSQSLRDDKSESLATVTSNDLSLAQAVSRSTELRAALQRFEAAEVRLRKNVRSFCDLVNQFELIGLRRLAFAPAVPLERGSQELVRSDAAKALSLEIEFDAELLPEGLKVFVASSPPKSKYWLARRVKSGEKETLNRSAAYFGSK